MSKHPFAIAMQENEQMGTYDVILQIGGARTKEEAERIAKVLAEFMGDGEGWFRRVQ